MKVLAIDIGSSSIKAAVLTGPTMPKRSVRKSFVTRFAGDRAEVDSKMLLELVAETIRELGEPAKEVDCIVPTGMAPSWVAMDKRGRPITPVVTHQDKRAIAQADAIERRIGKTRHLKLAGNCAVAGAISSPTAAWFAEHQPAVMKRADLVGHLNTLLLRNLAGVRALDTSNASFTGLFETTTLKGWHADLVAAAGVSESQLPDVFDASDVAGRVTVEAAGRFGLTEGTPVLAGIMDGSCAVLLAGAKPGQAVNVVGSTDVLAVSTDTARPDPHLLTRALGVGRTWLSVSTLSAAGTAIDWAHRTFYPDFSVDDYRTHLAKVMKQPADDHLSFDPLLAGSRTSNERPSATITGLSLAHGRDDLLRAMLNGLAAASAARLAAFDRVGLKLRRDVLSTGGGNGYLAKLLRRDWPGKWTFRSENDATLRGLWHVAENAK